MLGDSKISGMIPVKDLDAAKGFYADTLGLKVETEIPQATIFLTSGEGMIALYATEANAGKSPATVAGWAVGNIEKEVDELSAKGVTMEQYPDMGTNEKGISEQGGAKAAWFKDPDGNILALFQGPA